MALVERQATQAAPAPALDQPDANVGHPTETVVAANPTGTGGSRNALWLLIPVAVVAAALGVANRHAVAHQIAISVSRQPTPFTELYFTAPDALPTTLAVPGPDNFTFAIGNHEGRVTAYPYTVTLAGLNGSSVVAQGTAQVANRKSTTLHVTLYPPSGLGTFIVTVTLAGRSETIHFGGDAP